jgi:DNA-directed RNA polymerase specialized sigma24 family protein
MPLPPDVLDLIRQARAGDEAAWTALVHGIQPFIQRVARIRMRQHGKSDEIRHDVGSSDVCQSVFRSLFQGLRANRYRFHQPADLERLLRVMVRFNVLTKARKASVMLRELVDDSERNGWMDAGPLPDQEVADQDLVEVVQQQFSEEELEILTMWLDEVPWAEIGRKLVCAGDAARARLGRAVARVREKMNRQDYSGT